MDIAEFTSHRRTLATPAGDIGYTEFAATGAGTGGAGARGGGAGDVPTALFIHGVIMNGLLWRHVIEEVRDGTRCIAVDLPLHGSTPVREDLSVTAMAQMVADLCQGLGLDQVDLVGNDTGGAVVQIFAARNPGMVRSLVLTNCDTDGNFPPPGFMPVIESAARGELAPMLHAGAQDAAAVRNSPMADVFEHPELIADEEWLAYFEPIAGTMEHARDFERMLTGMDPAEMKAATAGLHGLTAPTLLVWGTNVAGFGLEWAYRLRDLIPGAKEVVEIDGVKLFFPLERPQDLAVQLRRHWAR